MLAVVIGANVIGFVVTLDHFHRGRAVGAKIRSRHVPADEIALGIVGAAVEGFACFGYTFAHVSAALGALAHHFHDFLDILALWIVGASKERTVFAVAHNHFCAALVATTSLSSSGI